MVEIDQYRSSDQSGVLAVILPIQRDEFDIQITENEQPDLKSIPDFYQTGGGGFWVARKDGTVIGTIGLKDIGDHQAALRKMFVAAQFRGREHGVARRLLERLIEEARAAGIRTIFLGTTDKFLSAHRFYEKHGFDEIGRDQLPERFPVMAVDSKFYAIDLG